MKHVLFGLVAAAALVLGGVGVASAQDAVKEKFYNFDDMLIDGDFKTPQGMYENARDKAKFQRLLDLKKSFLPKIGETVFEDVLDA